MVKVGGRSVTRRELSDGSWLDGSGFSGIRFVDRFELEGEPIVAQMVWNDIAEINPA